MMRILRFAVLIAFAWVAQSGSSYADYDWDWLDKMSGPGPSRSRDPSSSILGTVCWRAPFTTERTSSPTIDRIPCLFVDKRRFENGSDDNFPSDVKTNAFDFGVTWKVWKERFEIGAGTGFMHFDSQNRVTQATETTTKVTVTVPRLVVQPLRFIPLTKDGKLTGWNGRFARVLKFYYRETLVTGDLRAEDFATRTGSRFGQSLFSSSNEFVRSRGFIIDFGELLLYNR